MISIVTQVLAQRGLDEAGDHDPVHHLEGHETGGVHEALQEAHVLAVGPAEVRVNGPRRRIALARDRTRVQGHLYERPIF